MGEIIDRAKAPTPKFFKVLRNIGLIMAGVGTVLLTAPVSLPAAVVTLGGYLVTAGSVATAVSQITNLTDDAIGEKEKGGSDGDGNSP
jgi:ABC-type xylose transport system permease subunit